MPGGEPGSVVLLYTGRDQTGYAMVCGSVHGNQRYERWRTDDLGQQDMLYNIRSGTLFASTTGAAAVILFKQNFLWGSEFTGEFVQYINQHPTGQWDFNTPDEFYFNPGGGAVPIIGAMLVLETQRRNEFRISVRDTLLPLMDEFISEELPDGIILRGAPEITWTAFPRGIEHLSEDHIYIRITQDVELEVPDWANYDARINYWVHLHLNNGRMTGHVARWSYWLEGGIATSAIDPHLRDGVISGANALTNTLNERLAQFPPAIRAFYYLPGRQLAPVQEGVVSLYWANTANDVTIAFEVG